MTATKEKPILFSGEMVRAILDGRKTQTRRIVKPQPPDYYHKLCGPEHYSPIVVGGDGEVREGPQSLGVYTDDGEWGVKCPYEVGMRLWVREGHLLQECVCQAAPAAMRGNCRYCGGRGETVIYKADATCAGDSVCCRYRPSIHMPRWASRITLEITDIRVQRLQEISEEDAAAEGVESTHQRAQSVVDAITSMGFACSLDSRYLGGESYVKVFRDLWDSINTKPGTRWEDGPWVWCYTFRRVEA